MSPGLGRGAYRAQRELVLFLEKGHRQPNRRDLGDVLRFPRVVRGESTEKPVGLWKTLIGQSTQAGELVCDPFAGRGASALPLVGWGGVS
jgi:site-specific DNA-methyltransferase (adenine-specific)